MTRGISRPVASRCSCIRRRTPLSRETLHYAYEYDERHAGLLVYFDSWDDLEHKLRTTDFGAVRERAVRMSAVLTSQALAAWESLLAPLRRMA